MRPLLLSIAGALLLIAAGCNGSVKLDGLEASYVDPPAGYEKAPRFDHHGVRVYEVGGRYFREYNGRWVVFHEKPRDLREEKR